MTPPQLRTADGGDLDALLELAVAFYAEDGFATTRAQLAQHLPVLMAGDASRVAVVGAGRLVGFAVTTTSYGLENGLIAELEDLYIAPSARRQGLASRLIEDSAAWAASLRCRHLELVVAPNGSDVSQLVDFYAARGFRDEERRWRGRCRTAEPGIRVATVRKPAGSVFSIVENPHLRVTDVLSAGPGRLIAGAGRKSRLSARALLTPPGVSQLDGICRAKGAVTVGHDSILGLVGSAAVGQS